MSIISFFVDHLSFSFPKPDELDDLALVFSLKNPHSVKNYKNLLILSNKIYEW